MAKQWSFSGHQIWECVNVVGSKTSLYTRLWPLIWWMYLGLNCCRLKCGRTEVVCSVCCVSQGQFVSEYVGDLIDEQEARRRLTEAYRNNVNNFYMMTLDSGRWVNDCISNTWCKYCWIFSLKLDVKVTSFVNMWVQKHGMLYCIWCTTCERCKW